MTRIDLPALGAGPGLQFDWDPDTGTLSGRDAVFMQLAISHAVAEGSVTSHPWPTRYPVHDPLHRPADMALVLSQFCQLDGEWAQVFPHQGKAADGETDEGTVRFIC